MVTVTEFLNFARLKSIRGELRNVLPEIDNSSYYCCSVVKFNYVYIIIAINIQEFAIK